DSEFMPEPEMPTRGKAFLQGNFGSVTGKSYKTSGIDLNNIIYDRQDEEGPKEALRAVSFSKVISHRRLDDMDQFKAGNAYEDLESEQDEPGSASLFAGNLLAQDGKIDKAAAWSTTPMDAL